MVNFHRLVKQILKHMQITASFAIPPLMHPRQKRLQTFTNTKATRKKLKHIDRDLKIEQMCMNKQLVMLASGEQLSQDCGSNFIPRPCALVWVEGLPTKGNKSKVTNFSETRYKQVGVIVSAFPNSWTADLVILKGMFMTQTSPSPSITTFQQYTDMLLKRFTVPHLKNRYKKFIFYDDPDQTVTKWNWMAVAWSHFLY